MEIDQQNYDSKNQTTSKVSLSAAPSQNQFKGQQKTDQLEDDEEESSANSTSAAAQALVLSRDTMMKQQFQSVTTHQQTQIKQILQFNLADQNSGKTQSKRSQKAQNKQGARNNKGNSTGKQQNSFQNKKGGKKSSSLPIKSYPLNKLVVEVHQTDQNNEALVVIKHTQHQFATRAFEKYKDTTSSAAKRIAKAQQNPIQVDSLMQESTDREDIAKFTARKYYLFSKYDQGIKIDEEGWYSVTPETMAKYLANRVKEVFGEYQPVNVLDCFVGVGGNLIQFAKMSPYSYCLGVDLDQTKVEYTRNNAQVYGLQEHSQFQVVNSDFLKLQSYNELNLYNNQEEDWCQPDQFQFPNQHKQFDAAFISPPWGGNGYDNLQEYTMDLVYPEFSAIMEKVTQYTSNLMLFLPKNTSIQDIIKHLLPFSDRLLDQNSQAAKNAADSDSLGQNRGRFELNLEIQELIYGNSVKAIVVYTGDLAHIHNWEVAQYFIDNVCYQYKGQDTKQSSNDYLRSILQNIFNLCGYEHFMKHFKNQRKLSLPKIIKQIQNKFTQEEWYYLRKIHKKTNNFFLNQGGDFGETGQGWVDISSKKSSTVNSQMSIDESNASSSNNNHYSKTTTTSISDGTLSHRSRKGSFSSQFSAKRTAAGYKKKQTSDNNKQKHKKLVKATADTDMIDEENDDDTNSSHDSMIIEADEDEDYFKKQTKRVHFEQTLQSRGHIELKDLSRQDFEELIAAKNQDSRFYGWLNLQPLIQEPEDEDMHEWDKEIEWFKELQELFIEPNDYEDQS